uniref:TGB1 n=1 Tax=Peony betaflexivirus 1 TaxID=2800951 RepID=A0A7L7QTW8_9VIRU|nr:TGB1 [Peony betaflexivirus 1]
MNVLFKYLENSGFVRTNIELSEPIVVHAVPGAGKTTLLRKLIKNEQGFEVHTSASADGPTLEGVGIEKQVKGNSGFRILDEYITSSDYSGYNALFSDPIQNSKKGLPAHFVNYRSFRVPRSICHLINNKLKIPIVSDIEGVVTFEPFFGKDPTGVVIAIELDVIRYLSGYGINVKSPCEVRGLEFEEVSLFITQPLEALPIWEVFIALTRVKRKLIVRCIDVSSTS